MVFEVKPLSAPGGWEGFKNPAKSEDLPVTPEFLQPAVNGKLIKNLSLVSPHYLARCDV
jgi:hypothetical protein